MTVQDIYQILDANAPFSAQEPYDNSGLLVGSPDMDVHHILLTLDITVPVIEEAIAAKADLILSHHPIIWTPLKSLPSEHPVWMLARHNIAAICSHTCLDIAPNGLNTRIGHLLRQKLSFTDTFQPLELLPGDRVLGYTAALHSEINPGELASALGTLFLPQTLRYYDGGKPIRKIAWCTGSGGDLIETAIARGADALITGDCKHSVWVLAQNLGFSLFDCGHFETEVAATECFAEYLKQLPDSVQISVSKAGTTPYFQTLSR